MNAVNEEEKSSRKKLIVPIVVLMLCMVAMIGAAYAYNGQVNGNGTMDVDYVTIDFADSNVDSTTKKVTIDELAFNYEKSYENGAVSEKYTVADATKALLTISIVVKKSAVEETLEDVPTVTINGSNITTGYTVKTGVVLQSAAPTKDTSEDGKTITYTYVLKASGSYTGSEAMPGSIDLTIVATIATTTASS